MVVEDLQLAVDDDCTGQVLVDITSMILCSELTNVPVI